uniref:Uncharacterized protein n=1 Tax=Dactylella sp. TaxID=1814903 RepID=A0A482DVL4_9PEZI|nr:hypothetical protein [Dactylella sp.]
MKNMIVRQFKVCSKAKVYHNFAWFRACVWLFNKVILVQQKIDLGINKNRYLIYFKLIYLVTVILLIVDTFLVGGTFMDGKNFMLLNTALILYRKPNFGLTVVYANHKKDFSVDSSLNLDKDSDDSNKKDLKNNDNLENEKVQDLDLNNQDENSDFNKKKRKIKFNWL